MKNENQLSRIQHPVIRKCMKHLDVIGAHDKTKQIVYMYMKLMDDEILRLKKQNAQLHQDKKTADNW
ncbi:hypothetical protein [Siminovitchia sp. 179-K 8D1 HS]|uniref:hypothetical protein n=1 Tax=Siminovitchia sp. 179-K 8D1 HS TaxID=3142385 RepID=UPI0039A3A5CD